MSFATVSGDGNYMAYSLGYDWHLGYESILGNLKGRKFVYINLIIRRLEYNKSDILFVFLFV